MPTIILPGLRRQEHGAATQLEYAFNTARNRHSITRGDRNVISHAAAADLNAANPYARILWGNVLWGSLLQHFGVASGKALKVSLYWITLVDLACFTTTSAKPVNVRWVARHLCSGLRGLSYMGAVDLAYYAHVASGTGFNSFTGVNWHLHLIAWGEPPKKIRRRFAAMNCSSNNYRPIIPGGTGADCMSLPKEMLPIRFRYMVRTPTKAYSVGRRRLSGLEANGVPRFKHNHRRLRPGERIALFHLLKSKSLQEMTVAGGEGVAIRRTALRQVDRRNERGK